MYGPVMLVDGTTLADNAIDASVYKRLVFLKEIGLFKRDWPL